MKSFILFVSLFSSLSSFANLSATLKGKLTSYNSGSTQQGYYLMVVGDAAQELFNSIQSNEGVIDTMKTSQVDSKTQVTKNSTTIYSASMECTESVSNLSPLGKSEIKYEYSCLINIDKKGTIDSPARG